MVISTTSLTDFAVKVSLTVRKPQLSTIDKKATRAAEDTLGAHGAGRYRKDLYPKELVSPIIAAEVAARQFISRSTLDGVLPVADPEFFENFLREMSRYETAFNQAVTVFLNNYSSALAEAQHRQGGMFDPTIYPDVSELRNRFAWELSIEPVPAHSHYSTILSTLSDALRSEIERQIRRQNQTQTRLVVEAAKEKLESSLKDFAEAMARPTRRVVNKRTGAVEERQPIIREAVLENLSEALRLVGQVADLLPPDYKAVLGEASALPTKYRIDEIRADSAVREILLGEANGLLVKLGKEAVKALEVKGGETEETAAIAEIDELFDV